MKDHHKRPVNLNFFGIDFPITAWVSIGHRLSGLFLFLCIPALLFGLQESLSGIHQFRLLKIFLTNPWCMGLMMLFLAALAYHALAGVRHLLMDLQIGIGKKSSVLTARLLLVITILLFFGLYKRFLC